VSKMDAHPVIERERENSTAISDCKNNRFRRFCGSLAGLNSSELGRVECRQAEPLRVVGST